MLEHTYSKWLEKEVVAIKYALMVALEKRDRLLYIEAPALKEEYMRKFGAYEEKVLKAELEVALAEKKKQLIQTAINRREQVNLEEIEKQLEEVRKKQLEQLNQNYRQAFMQNSLLPEEKEELQNLYKDIVRDFHPEVHKEMTDFQKQLYKRALVAYQRQQLEELRLVYDMLYTKDIEEIMVEISNDSKFWEVISLNAAERLIEDYSLAAEVFECFEPLEADAILLSTKQQYEVKEKDVWEEIERIQKEFPFIAKETMQSEELTKEYMKSLEGRMNACNENLESLNRQINDMLGA